MYNGDSLCKKFNAKGYHTQRCADDLAMVVVGKNLNTIAKPMQRGLKKLTPGVNPIKRWNS